MQYAVQLDDSWSRNADTLPKNVKKLHLGKWNSTFEVHWISPWNAESICWIWRCSDPQPQNKLTIGSGSKTTVAKGPRSGAKGGPPRYTVVKWAEILAPSQMTSYFSSRHWSHEKPMLFNAKPMREDTLITEDRAVDTFEHSYQSCTRLDLSPASETMVQSCWAEAVDLAFYQWQTKRQM